MRVTGLNPDQLRWIARDAGLRVEWWEGNPRVARGNFRLVPTGERYRLEGNDNVCPHGIYRFLVLAFKRGAVRIETPIRDYDSLDEVKEQSQSEILDVVEARYGKQTCRCLKTRP